MSDITTMMREQAVSGLQMQLDKAVTDGDTAAARKISDDLAKLAVSTAPKAPPYGQPEILAEFNKLDWFGVDPKKSARVIELGKHMDPKKFATAELFTAALTKAVDEEFKPAGGKKDDEEEEEDPENEGEDTIGEKPPAKPRRTDSPGEGDNNVRAVTRRTSGPWVKLSDAPSDIREEIKRSTDKFVPSHATKEQRESFVSKALESHYAAHQRKAGKK